MPNDEVNAPEAFAALWLVLGVVGLLLLVLWPLAVWFFTRPRPPKPATVETTPVPQARERAVEAIEQVRRAAAIGQLSPRAAHQSVSTIVRTFVSEVTGTPADRMDLSELRALLRDHDQQLSGAAAPLTRVADWIEVLYPPEFAPQADRSVDQTCDEAVRLVGQWAPAGEGS